MGGVVAARAIRVGGSTWRSGSAVPPARVRHAVGERRRNIKREIGSAYPTEDEPKAEVRAGSCYRMPKTVTISPREMRSACEMRFLRERSRARRARPHTPSSPTT